MTGYGLDGPAAERPAFDYIIQADTGIAAMCGEPDAAPTLAGYSIVDNSSSIMAALALLAKVHEGKGGQVDVSLFDVMLAQLNYKAAAYLNGGVVPPRSHLGAHSFYVPAQLFETASGYLALFVTHDEFWRRLCAEIGCPEWANDPRFATMHDRFDNRVELIAGLSALLKEATAVEWERRFQPLGIPAGAAVTLEAVLDSEFLRSRGLVTSVETDDGPLARARKPDTFRWSAGRVSARRRDCTSTLTRCSGRSESVSQCQQAR